MTRAREERHLLVFSAPLGVVEAVQYFLLQHADVPIFKIYGMLLLVFDDERPQQQDDVSPWKRPIVAEVILLHPYKVVNVKEECEVRLIGTRGFLAFGITVDDDGEKKVQEAEEDDDDVEKQPQHEDVAHAAL